MANNFLQLLQDAVDSPHGVKVFTDNPAELRKLLYQQRQGLDSPELAALQLRIAPNNPSELWILQPLVSAPAPTHASENIDGC